MIRGALAAMLLAGPAGAVTLELPGSANVTAESVTEGSARLPTGVFADGIVPTREYPGRVSQQAWTFPGAFTTYQVLTPLREQLEADGFRILVDCETQTCGGFDFRFAIEVLPEPGMHVDLGDYRFVSAEKAGADGTEAVSLLVSRSESAAFLQVEVVETAPEAETGQGGSIRVTPGAGPGPDAGADVVPFTPGTLAATLESQGFVVLDDLDFGTGTTTLGDGTYASLSELSDYLKAHPNRAVVLVGHTDATGGLDVNITVSRRRALAVSERLAVKYGVPRAQVSAEGVGYLAPRSSNLTEAGRTANRRVEVVLVSTE